MKALLICSIAIVSITCSAADLREQKARREFYEYDVVGTRKDRIKRNIGHGAAKTVVAPFRAVRWTFRGIKRMIRSVSNNAEVFLTEAGGLQGEQRKLHQVLRGWEGSDDLKSIIDRERKKGRRFLFGIPHDAYQLLKDTLIAAGFRLPAAVFRGLHHLVVGTYHVLIQ